MVLKTTIFAADQWPFFALDKTHIFHKFESRAVRFWSICKFWSRSPYWIFIKPKTETIDFKSCHWYRLFLMILKITIFAADQWPVFALDKTHTLQKFEGRALRFWIFRTAQIGRLNFYEHGWYFAFRWISKTLILAGTWCIFWVAPCPTTLPSMK